MSINWHEDVLVELRRIRQAIEKLLEVTRGRENDPLPATVMRGEEPIWACGHRHPDRQTAATCLLEHAGC